MFVEAIAINMLLSAGLLLLILHLDRYEREPLRRVLVLLAISVAATTLLGVAKQLIWGDSGTTPLCSAYLRAGLPEELLKFGLFVGVARRWKTYNESFDAVVYLSIIATGFAFNENIAYYMQATSGGALAAELTGDSGLYYRQLANVVAARLVPSHLLVDINAAFLVGLGKVRGRPWRYLLLGLVVAVALHGTWNYLAGTGLLAWFVFYEFVLSVLVCCAVLLSLRASRFRARQAALARLIDENLILVRHGLAGSRTPGDPDEIAALLDRLAGLLDRCRLLAGEQQERIFELLDRELPFPVTEHLDRGEPVGPRLAALVRHLSAVEPRARLDWRYSLGVFLVLVGTATVAYLLSLLVGDLVSRVLQAA
jgi:RsiW-degrading membrane proteinase PrsW (M82 family)